MESYGIGASFLLLMAGSVLTVITIQRMRSGRIVLPGWSKTLLIIAMIGMLLITLIGMLPPMEVTVTNPFINEDTHIVTPADPSCTAAPGK